MIVNRAAVWAASAVLITAATATATSCEWVVQLQGTKFVLANNGKAVCGKLVAYHA